MVAAGAPRAFAGVPSGENGVMVFLLAVLVVIVLFALGIAVIGLTVKLLWWALVGLVIGGLGRLVLPGAQPIGVLATALLGIAAALLGGIVAHALDVGTLLQFVIAVGVAAALVALFGRTRSHRTV
jgi:uncharacterized membrane protein YeaQ/YmgE (transglycosylase-associated protein family)